VEGIGATRRSSMFKANLQSLRTVANALAKYFGMVSGDHVHVDATHCHIAPSKCIVTNKFRRLNLGAKYSDDAVKGRSGISFPDFAVSVKHLEDSAKRRHFHHEQIVLGYDVRDAGMFEHDVR